MNVRRLLAALLMALFGSAIFTFWISKKLTKPVDTSRRQQYVATTQDLNAGDLLQRQSLALVDWQGDKPLEGAFAKTDDLVGRTVLYPLSAGEPIRARYLATAGSGIGLSTRIPEGMRAMSLRTDQIVGVAGFLVPGSHVDVLVTFHTPASPDPITATVLQDVQILATGQKMQPDPEGKIAPTDVVTLLVNPQDAEKVVLASAQGTVHFVLRNGADHVVVSSHSAELSELSDKASLFSSSARPVLSSRSLTLPAFSPQAGVQLRTKAVTPPMPPGYTVVTNAGGKQTTESFQ